MGSSSGPYLLLLLALHCADARLPISGGRGGAAPGTTCWYPNYYCSVTAGNVQKETVMTGGADQCYNDCNSDGSCLYFTWFKRRGVEYCYFLDECGEDFHVKNDYCSLHDSCYSGPKDCTSISPPNVLCPKLGTTSDEIEWQCEDGGTGLNVNGYNGTIEAGARCILSCDSWQSFRWAEKSQYNHKGYLFSACEADGTWSAVLPNDFEDGQTSLEWPTTENLTISAYPKPSEGSISCGCRDLVLVWPPQNSSLATGNKFYYNPRTEAGARMECDDEVQNSLVESTNMFSVVTNNTCDLLCDDYLVATVTCVDGSWTGETQQGFWCYEYPKEEDRLEWV